VIVPKLIGTNLYCTDIALLVEYTIRTEPCHTPCNGQLDGGGSKAVGFDCFDPRSISCWCVMWMALSIPPLPLIGVDGVADPFMRPCCLGVMLFSHDWFFSSSCGEPARFDAKGDPEQGERWSLLCFAFTDECC